MFRLRHTDGDAQRRTARQVRQPDIFHIAEAGIGVAHAAGQIGCAVGDVPAGQGGSGAEDEEAWVPLEEEGEVLHEALAQSLCVEKVDGWCVFSYCEEDFVGCIDARERGDAGAELRQDGHGVRELAFD